MKKIILLFLFFNICNSQNKLGSYTSPFFDKYDVEITEPNKKGNYDFLIYAHSTDNIVSNVALRVSNKKITSFIDYLITLKQNHIEWKKKAEDNDIKDIEKDIDIKSKDYYYASFLYSSWYKSHGFFLKPVFKSLPGLGYVTVLYSNKLKATENQFVNSKGLMFVFNTEEQFDELIAVFSEDNIKNYFAEKKRKEDLFKN
jgi:hypothetical protein